MNLAQFAVDCGYDILHNVSDGLGFVDELAVKDFLCDVRPSELYHSGYHEASGVRLLWSDKFKVPLQSQLASG